MKEIDKMVLELEKRYQEEVKKQEEALNEKALADEMKEEAIKKERAAKAALKELEIAKNHAKKAQESYNIANDTVNNDKVEAEGSETTDVEENVKNKKKNGRVSGFILGTVTTGLILTGAWALSKDSLTGEVRAASWFKRNDKKTGDEAIIETDGEVATEKSGFVYDYEHNVVVVPNQINSNPAYAYDFEANAAEDPKFVDANGNNIPVITDAGQAITNPIVNTEIPSNLPYVELTTERFEEITTNLIQKYEGLGLDVSREKIIKYVMLRNIDKLRQDNNELIIQIIGNQDIFEVITDACDVVDAIRNYNILYFSKYHTTDGFISAVDGVFDEEQRARATEIERRVYEIGANFRDEVKYNELIYTLLRDMYNPLNPISQLEDGVSYGIVSDDIYMLRTLFGQEKNFGGLNDMNIELIKYFVSFPEDADEYTDNSLMNGNVTNIVRLLSECDVKTRTK